MPKISNHTYLHSLQLAGGFSPQQLMSLCQFFDNNFREAFLAKRIDLETCNIKMDTINKFLKNRERINLEREATQLSSNNIGIISYVDPEYPRLLHEMSIQPPLLYYRGKLPDTDILNIAVVGTRKMTPYGNSVTQSVCHELVRVGVTIVSGLAYGIDAVAHRAALKQYKPTIAVLASGLRDMDIYPKNHALLAQEILDSGGLLVSEYPPGTPAFKQHFLARNRIIAGLSVGSIIVECGLKSGALITAKYALEQNRAVYAVPGSIFNPQSTGPNNLLKLGAKPVTEATDILEDLNINPSSLPETSVPLTSVEAVIVNTLAQGTLTSSELIEATKLGAEQVISALTFLEMKGVIKHLGAQQYTLMHSLQRTL